MGHRSNGNNAGSRVLRGRRALYALFSQLTDNILQGTSDNRWTATVTRLYLLNVEIGNKLHSKHYLPDMKHYIYESVCIIDNNNNND